jgi:hypothetical protein
MIFLMKFKNRKFCRRKRCFFILGAVSPLLTILCHDSFRYFDSAGSRAGQHSGISRELSAVICGRICKGRGLFVVLKRMYGVVRTGVPVPVRWRDSQVSLCGPQISQISLESRFAESSSGSFCFVILINGVRAETPVLAGQQNVSVPGKKFVAGDQTEAI